MADCADPHCVHCAASELLLARQPLSPRDACLLGQVIADIVASVPDAGDRALHASYLKREIDKMLVEAVAGTWQREEREAGHG